MRRAIAAFAFLVLTAPAYAGSLAVPMDQARMITFAKPVATIYVANPVVADVNLIDNRRAFVLGKAFGSTNIIALDANGEQIANSTVTVLGREDSTVTLFRGANQSTLTCAGRCEAAPMPGDSKDSYDNAVAQIEQHQDQGKKAAQTQ